MKKHFFRYLLLILCLGVFTEVSYAQKGKRTATKRTTTRKTTKTKTKAKVQTAKADTVSVAATAPAPAVNDSLPVPFVKKSLRPDEAVDTKEIKDRTPLAYEHLRADDAVFRHKVWREIDTREKLNLPFRYAANENNGNQRFISILFKAIQDDMVTVFDAIDDRFTTPLTKMQVSEKIAGAPFQAPIYDSTGQISGYKTVVPEVNLDSFYRFRIKEEVIFDKESSRLFWRILGIAPVKDVITSTGVNLGPKETFWVYYPDMRPVFSKYEVYNGKNFGARMSWEELFESRMFYGRIYKSTINNPYDLELEFYPGFKDNRILQLLEGENIKETIFNYEQDLWSY
jgi:gliding motility associated protien GldN